MALPPSFRKVAQNKNAADKTSGAKRLSENYLNQSGQNGFIFHVQYWHLHFVQPPKIFVFMQQC